MKPWDKVTARERDTRMFMFISSYGYIINVNHPEILPLYNRFKEKHKIPSWCPMSDNERYEFERCIINSRRFLERFESWYSKYKYLMPAKTVEIIEELRGGKREAG